MAINFFMVFTDLPVHLLSFLEYLQFEKRYSEHTVRAYHDDLVSCFDFWKVEFEVTDPREVTTAFVRTWLASLKQRGLTAKSINRKISSLKSYFKFQLRAGMVGHNPMTIVVSPRVGKRLPVYVEQKDIAVLFRDVEFPEGLEGMTHRLILAIFYQTGVRLSELIGLKEGHVDVSNGLVKVLGKGNKERLIPVDGVLVQAMQVYCADKRRLLEAPDREVLLVNGKGKRLTARYVYVVVTHYLGFVTTMEKKSPHVLRHTFATHLTNNGADLNAVKALLGHASLAATQVYTHNTIDKLKEIHARAHPKA